MQSEDSAGIQTETITDAGQPAIPGTIGAALAELRSLSDEIDSHTAALKNLNQRWDELERFLEEQGETLGLRSFSDGGITASLTTDLRVSYDPAQWDGLLKWAIETGNTGVVQRRLGDRVLKDLLDAGQAIPPGITFHPYTKVSIRRK